MRQTSAFRMVWLIVVTAILTVLTVGVGDRLVTHWAYAVERGRIQADSDELADYEELAGMQAVANAFRLVSRVARPGVVHIRVRGIDESVLRERLGEDIDEEELQEHMRRFRDRLVGSGSGIVFDDDGYIITNNHVVGGRNEISVTLADNRQYDATIVGTDRKTDVAVIKIDAPNLHPLKFGDSDKMEVGDWVLAVGAPFGLTQTVTHGIISATGRTSIRDVPILYQNFLQTDAAVNPGNSGGPLLNLHGEVVGVNTAIATNGDTVNAGVAFVIPSNMVVKVANELKKHGEVTRGWLGVSMNELADEDREILGIRKSSSGVLVNTIVRNTPAEKAGLNVEDVILEVNGKPIRDIPHIRSIIADIKPGQVARLKLVRDRRILERKIRMARQPENTNVREAEPITGRELADLGLLVRSFRPRLTERGRAGIMRRLHYDPSDRGVVVLGGKRRALRRSGLSPRDLIVGCNGTPVTSIYELTQAIQAADAGSDIELQVMNEAGENRTVVISGSQ